MNEIEETNDELETLKSRADMMGIRYNRNIGMDKLREKINLKLSGKDGDSVSTSRLTKGKRTWLTHDEYLKEVAARERKDINRLIRIRVTCMNPNKKNWEGEIFSVGSAKLGTFKKYVPFNTEDGWHVPKIIYDVIKERKFTSFQKVKGPRGEEIRKGKLVPEFSVEVLPPLTDKELKELARRQAISKVSD